MLVITPALKQFLIASCGASEGGADDYYRTKASQAIAAGTLTTAKLEELTKAGVDAGMERVKTAVREVLSESSPAGAKRFGGPSIAEITGAAGSDGAGVHIRVKCAGESYLDTKSVGKHVKLGVPVNDEQGRPAMLPSEFEHAKAGAFLKYLAAKAGLGVVLSEHERGLFNETLEKDVWVGRMGSDWSKEVPSAFVKQLLSDSTSGGLEVNPIWFDENIIQFPLLNGELFPLVDVREVPRSSRVEGASIGNPTVQWGIAEGTAAALFNTDSLCAEINTTIFPVNCFVEVGRDFLNDAAADVGRVLEDNIGQALMKELDNVIANGNGTDRPEGLFTASGLTSVSSANSASGPPALADFEGLLFGVGKQYRTSKSCAFVGNDTLYRRTRAIQVDPHNAATTVNQLRVFGMSHEDYMILGRPFKVQNDIANTKAIFGDMKKYRLYRRLGMSLEWITQDSTLARRNVALLAVRARFGGKIMDANAFAKMTDLQT